MSDELEQHVPKPAGARTPRGFLPGIHFQPDDGLGGGGDGAASAVAGGDGAGAAADVGAGGDGAAAVGDGGDGGTVATVTPQLAPAPTGIDFTDPDVVAFLDARASSIFQTQMQPLLPLLEQVLGGGTAPAAPAGGLDPWDDGFAGNLDARFAQIEQLLQNGLQQLAEPLRAGEREKAMAEGEQRLQDILADDISRHGEFSTKPEVDKQARELVRTISGHIYDGLADRFGGHAQVVNQGIGPRLSEAAMVQAATTIRSLLEAERATGAMTEANRLATLAGATGEPPAAVGVQTIPPVRARSIEEGLRSVTERHAEAIRNATP